MDAPSKPWREVLVDVPEYFVKCFTLALAGLLGTFLIAFPLTDWLFRRDAGSFDFWREKLPELLPLSYGVSLALAGGFVLLVAIGRRWYAVLFPAPTEVERLRPLSLVRVLGGTALAVAGTLSLTLLAGDMFHVTFKPWLEGVVGGYRESVSVLSPMLAVPFDALFAGIKQMTGLDAALDRDWLHTIIFLAGFFAVPYVFSEVWPPPEGGRLSFRRVWSLLVLIVLVALFLITERPRTFLVAIVAVAVFNLIEHLIRVIRRRDGGCWRLVLGALLSLLVPAVAGAAILIGAV